MERENPRFPGVFNAAEWSRTITPREGHKALNLARLPVPPQPLEGATILDVRAHRARPVAGIRGDRYACEQMFERVKSRGADLGG